MKTIELSTKSQTYKKVLAHFRFQYPNIEKLTCLYVNSDKKIIGGEWIDKKNNFNLTSENFETVKIIKIID